MTAHSIVAAAIAADVSAGTVPALRVTKSARQGDVTLRRVGDAAPTCAGVPAGGLVLAAGEHGEHRLLAVRARLLDGEVLDLPGGGVVVHTDTPDCRHEALRLTPGRWRIGHLRELDLDESIVRVRD